MRSLTVEEVAAVGGGGYLQDIQNYTAFGATAGSAIGYIMTGTAVGATNGGLFGGAAMFSFSVGYAIGTIFYNSIC